MAASTAKSYATHFFHHDAAARGFMLLSASQRSRTDKS